MKTQILDQYIIRPALQYLDMESEAAVNLLLGTCAQESNMGVFVRQMDNGPAVGIYQIEPTTHDDIYDNYITYRDELQKKMNDLRLGTTKHEQLSSSIFYQSVIARLIYYRVAEKLPNASDVKGLANYWKKYYNTPKGHGTPEQFVHNYYKYVKAA